MLRHATLAVFAGALLIARTADADNGQLAHALAVAPDTLTVDGQLNDWPLHLPSYAIAFDGDGAQQPASGDFDARFRAAYAPASNALYLALEVLDDTHSVATDADGDWSRQDGVILYLDLQHSPAGSGSVLYSATGEHRRLMTDENSWDPAVRSASWDNVALAVSRGDDQRTVYEWRIEAPMAIAAGTSIGLDFLVSDDDTPGQEDPATLYSWGRGFGKSQSGGRLGDLLLIDGGHPLGTLEGKVRWQGTEPAADGATTNETVRPRRVRITGPGSTDRVLHAAVDEAGHYELMLPRGAYQVALADRTLGDPWGDLQVVGESTTVRGFVNAAQRTVAPDLVATAAPFPDVFEDKGVLFDFDGKTHAEKVDSTITALMAYYNVPGVSVALVKDGTTAYARTFGLSNVFADQAATEQTLFEAASITKIVFAFAVNRMAERGEIDLDRPLHEYLPFEEIAHDPRYRKITARHVLSHQTGFPNWRWATADGRMQINFHPGTRYGYSGEGFEYLGRIAATLSKKPLEQLVYDEVVTPMGFAEKTFFSANDTLAKVASRGHYGGMSALRDFPAQIGVAHSMYTQAGAFANFMTALIAREGLSQESYAKMLEPQVHVPLDPQDDPQWQRQYGLGFHLMESPYGLVYGHGGNNGDFVCMFEVYDEHDMGFIVFTNADTGAKLVNALRRYLIMGNSTTSSLTR